MVKIVCFCRYLFVSIYDVLFFGGVVTCFLAKVTHVVFSGLRCTTRSSLHIGLSACIICDNRRGAL